MKVSLQGFCPDPASLPFPVPAICLLLASVHFQNQSEAAVGVSNALVCSSTASPPPLTLCLPPQRSVALDVGECGRLTAAAQYATRNLAPATAATVELELYCR